MVKRLAICALILLLGACRGEQVSPEHSNPHGQAAVAKSSEVESTAQPSTGRPPESPLRVEVERGIFGSFIAVTSVADEITIRRISVNRDKCWIEPVTEYVPFDALEEGQIAVERESFKAECSKYRVVETEETFESCGMAHDHDRLADDMRALGLLGPQMTPAPNVYGFPGNYETRRHPLPLRLGFADNINLGISCDARSVLEVEFFTSQGSFLWNR